MSQKKKKNHSVRWDEEEEKQEEYDNIRPFDRVRREALMPSISPAVFQSAANFGRQREDTMDESMRIAIEESIQMYERERIHSQKMEELERERIERERERQHQEEERVSQLRERMGILISRLKTVFRDDTIAKDILIIIEWECTPTHQLESFRPMTIHSLEQIRQWIDKNLNPQLKTLLKELSVFV